MLRVIKYEILKLVCKKTFLITLIVGVILNIFIFYQGLNTYQKDYANKNNNKYSVQMHKKVDDINKWVQFKDAVIRDAKVIKNNGKDTYMNKRITKLSELLSKVKKPKVINDYACNDMFNYICPWFIIGLILIIALAPIFSDEYSKGTDNILMTCKEGKKNLVTSKLITCCIISVIIFVIFAVIDLTLYFSYYNLKMNFNSIQSVSSFLSSPYNINIFNYLGLMLILKLLGVIAFGILIMYISSKSQSLIVTIVSSGLVLYLPFIIPFSENTPLGLINEFSYQRILNVNDFFNNYKVFNIFSNPILYFNIILIVFIFLTVALIFLTYRTYVERQITVETYEE